MTEPDEARIAWNACAAARYDDEENGNPLGLPQGMPNFEDFKDGYRAGAAASAERIKELEARVAEFEWALTPSGDTKSAYIGEFKQAVEDENVIIIEWTVVKEIMEAIRKFALLKEPGQ